MKTKILAAALVVAVIHSTAAIAAPKGRTTDSGYQPGQWFNCVVLIPGPTRTGPCWVDQLNGG
jgi:hypothetical protein